MTMLQTEDDMFVNFNLRKKKTGNYCLAAILLLTESHSKVRISTPFPVWGVHWLHRMQTTRAKARISYKIEANCRIPDLIIFPDIVLVQHEKMTHPQSAAPEAAVLKFDSPIQLSIEVIALRPEWLCRITYTDPYI